MKLDCIRYSLLVATLLFSAVIFAAMPRDDAANAKIKQAISVHYLATQFDKAEATLLEVPTICADQCSPEVLGRAWMYVGLVRSVGRADTAGARTAFAEALKAYPETLLDADLETPEAKALWEQVRAGGAPTPTEKPTALGGMQCSPNVKEVQTRRPIPVACTTDQPATRAEIKYREFGSAQWKTVQMGSAGGKWLGTIPCSATDLQGKLSWYVNARDQNDELIDNFGAQRQPIELQLVENTTEEPPAYPDQEPPARCGAASECPTEMLGTPACPGTVKPDSSRGNAREGDDCQSTQQCVTGLECATGTCQPPKSCERDTDCSEGRCVDLLCRADPNAAKGDVNNWIGLHFAADLALVSGDDVCESSSFACFYDDGSLQGSHGETFTGAGTNSGNVQSGFALGTLRVLASYERVISQFGVEGRAGFAFNGAPSATGVSFLPIHVEARGKYWPLGAPARKLFNPYVFVGGGVAQVDAKVTVVIAQNCNGLAGCTRTPEVDAYQQMGVGFISAGGGALLVLGPSYGINLNLNAQYQLPKSGLVLQPALGFNYGF